jgi:hypothetical protein
MPLGLLGFLLLVAGVEWTVARHDLTFTRQDNWEWRLSARASRRAATSSAVLAFGSSLMKLGVAPQVIERELGLSTYNLGICAGPAPASYFLLRRALEAGARPRIVLVDYHPLVLTHGPWHASPFWPDLLETRECLELAWKAGDPGYFAAMTCARLVPSVKDRREIRRVIVGAIGGEPSSTLSVEALRRNVATNRGALLVPKVPGTKVRIPREEAAVRIDSWECSALNARYVHEFMTLAAQHEVAVVWVMTPLHPDLSQLREGNGLQDRYRQFARSIIWAHPNVIVAEAIRSGYTPDLFVDSQHRNRDGAACLSAGVAEAIRGVVEHGVGSNEARWVTVGPPRMPSGELAIEDYGMSVERIQQVAGLGKREVRK